MKPKNTSAPQSSSPSLWIWLPLVCVLFLVARYAAAPMTGFVLDDWNYLRYAQMWPDGGEVARQGFAKDLNRPLSTMVMAVGFYLFDLNLLPYMFLLVAGHVLILLLATALVHRWNGGDTRQTFLFAVFFAVFPLLTESFYFPMLSFVMAVVGVPLYLASAYGISRYAEAGKGPWLALALGTYGFNLFWYEAGALLPAAFAVLLFGRRPLKQFLLAMGGYGVLFVFYFAWRSTEAFGLLESTTPAHMKASASGLEHIIVNAKELVRWWVGNYGLDAWRNGLEGYGTLGAGRRVTLLIANCLLCCAVAVVLSLLAPSPQRGFNRDHALSWPRFLIFMTVWFVVTSVPPLMSYVVSRLLLLPSIAVLAVAARFLFRFRNGGIILIGAPLLFLAMTADQGTNQQWKQSADTYKSVYEHLLDHKAGWVDKEIVLFDTRALRGAKGDPDPIRAVAFNGNASMLRGSGLREMIWRAGREWPKGKGRLDVEYRAELTETELWLHGRYDPDGPVKQRVPLKDVYILKIEGE